MRVLVIEDDREMAQTVAVGLRQAQMAVDVAFDGPAGLERALACGYDAVADSGPAGPARRRGLRQAHRCRMPTQWVLMFTAAAVAC